MLISDGAENEAWLVHEPVVLAFDLHNVGMPGDQPERPVAVGFRPMHRRAASQAGKQRVIGRLIDVRPGICDRLADCPVVHRRLRRRP